MKFLHYTKYLCGVVAIAATGLQAHAADWPSKPITLVVPYAAGGTTDRLARSFSKYVQDRTGQSTIVLNKPGASTNIGNMDVANAKPDGYTFLIGIDLLATNQATGPKLPFDPLSKLAPVSLLTYVPCLIAANPKFEANSGKEMIMLARKNPKEHTISSATLLLQVGLLTRQSDIDLTHIPYKGGAPAALDAMGGQVDMVIANVPVLAGFVRSGKLKALAVSSETRTEAFPDVPTLKETGLSTAVFANWYSLFAPVGTSPEIIDKMGAIAADFVKDPQVRKDLVADGYLLESSTPEQLRAIFEKDLDKARKFVNANKTLFAQ